MSLRYLLIAPLDNFPMKNKIVGVDNGKVMMMMIYYSRQCVAGLVKAGGNGEKN